MDHWVNRYVGIPYIRGGRGHAGCDCWGLIQLVCRERRGIRIPDMAADRPADAEGIDEAALVEGWAEVPLHATEPFDVVRMNTLLRGRPVPFHVGIFATPDLVLHTDAFGQGRSVVEDARQGGFQWRLIKAYRHLGT